MGRVIFFFSFTCSHCWWQKKSVLISYLLKLKFNVSHRLTHHSYFVHSHTMLPSTFCSGNFSIWTSWILTGLIKIVSTVNASTREQSPLSVNLTLTFDHNLQQYERSHKRTSETNVSLPPQGANGTPNVADTPSNQLLSMRPMFSRFLGSGLKGSMSCTTLEKSIPTRRHLGNSLINSLRIDQNILLKVIGRCMMFLPYRWFKFSIFHALYTAFYFVKYDLVSYL